MATELDSILISIRLKQDKIQRDLTRLERRFRKTFRNVDKSVRKTRSGFEELASSIFTVRNVIAAIGTLGVFRGFREAITSFADFETGLVAIGKTTDIEGKRLENLGRQIEQLSFKLPIATTGLLEIGAAAGQMGIDTEEGILAFTKTLGEIQLATDVIGASGARAIARILKVTDTAITDVDRFGAVLVKLGNTAAATEAEILEVAAKIGRAAAAFDISPQFLLAIAASTKELAGTAEIAGTQVNLLIQKINSALNAAGTGVHDFSVIMDDSIENLTKRFNEDAEPVVLEFIRRLNQLGKTGAGPALAALGLTGARINAVFGPLGDNIEVVAKNFFNARDAWTENTELMREALRAADTFSSRMQILRNILRSVARELAGKLLDNLGRFLAELGIKTIENIEAVANAIRGLTVALGTLIGLQFGGAIVFLLRLLRPTKVALIGVSLAIAGATGVMATFSKKTVEVNGKLVSFSSVLSDIGSLFIPTLKQEIEDLNKKFKDAFGIDMSEALDKFLEKFIKITISIGTASLVMIKSIDTFVRFIKDSALDILSGSFDRLGFEFESLLANIVTNTKLARQQIEAAIKPILLGSVGERPDKPSPFEFPDLSAARFTQFGSKLDEITRKTQQNIKVLKRTTSDYNEVLIRLIDEFNLSPESIGRFVTELEKVQKVLEEEQGLIRLKENLETFRNQFENTFDDILDSAMEGKINLVNIFTSMVDEIIKEILRLAIIQPILDAIFGNEKTGSLGSLGKILGSGKKEDKKSAQPVKVLGVTDVKVLEKINVEGLEEGTDKLLQQGDVSNNLLIKLASIMAALGSGGGGGGGLGSLFDLAAAAIGFFGGGGGGPGGGGGTGFLGADGKPVGAFAQGTPNASRGLAFVGEQGPELINFRGGEQVFNSQMLEGMLTPRSTPTIKSGGDTFITIDARNSIGEEALSASVESALARSLPNMVNAATNSIILQHRRDPRIFDK